MKVIHICLKQFVKKCVLSLRLKRFKLSQEWMSTGQEFVPEFWGRNSKSSGAVRHHDDNDDDDNDDELMMRSTTLSDDVIICQMFSGIGSI